MSQMRLEFSNLNSHLYSKLQMYVLIPHYVPVTNQTKQYIISFLVVNYTHSRERNFTYHYHNCPFIVIHPSVNIVLLGIRHESIDDNLTVLHIIQSYIKDTNRFT